MESTRDKKYFMYRLSSLLCRLPHGAVLAAAATAGRLIALFPNSHKKIAIKQCSEKLKISKKEAKTIISNVFAHFAMCAAEMMRLPVTAAKIGEIVRVHGLDNILEALTPGKGVFVITAHIGNWEYAAVWLSRNVRMLHAFSAAQRDMRMNKFLADIHSSVGVKTILKSKEMRNIFAPLKNGEILATAIDQDAKEFGILSDFLGSPASTPLGVVKLARKTGCAIVPVFCIRAKDNRTFDAYICPKLTGRDGREFGEDIQESIDICNSIMSDWIRRYPDQWMWMYPRWQSVERGLFDVVRDRSGKV